MSKLMRWFSRSVFPQAHVSEGSLSSIEHIDARHLAATDFRSSDAMRLDGIDVDGFCETLPAFARGQFDGANVARR